MAAERPMGMGLPPAPQRRIVENGAGKKRPGVPVHRGVRSAGCDFRDVGHAVQSMDAVRQKNCRSKRFLFRLFHAPRKVLRGVLAHVFLASRAVNREAERPQFRR